MRFTSLVIELIRARPRLVVWIVVLLQAALWLFVALVFYRSPPTQLATLLAFGREYQVGTALGPPLAAWLADIAYRAAGNHMIGVYVLAELCEVATFIALLSLVPRHRRFPAGGVGRAADHDGAGLPRRCWTSDHRSWRARSGRCCCCIPGNCSASAAAMPGSPWSIEAGLLLLTTPAAIGLLLLLLVFALVTSGGGRRTLRALDPLFALLVVVVLALPYAIWLIRANVLALPALPQVADLEARGIHTAWLFGGLVLGAATIPMLVFLNTSWFAGKGEEAPIIYRPPVEPLARRFVYFFALAPALCAVVISGLFGLDGVIGGPGVLLVMSGLAVVGCGRRSHRDAAAARAARGVGGGDRRACCRASCWRSCCCPGPARARSRPRCRAARSPISSTTALRAAPITACAQWLATPRLPA